MGAGERTTWRGYVGEQYPEVVNVRCPEGTKGRIGAIAEREGVKPSSVVRRAMLEYLDRQEEDAGDSGD